ncbi:hypothetical protein KCL53_002299 [Clostridium perfringens]|uniref:Uncharacterized protein n=1 Tax=Clostridium perfringens F262 TaxID=883064 RepID=A0AAV3FC59_CLOPF|nr:hypothetical protein [Clostridium perfringens]EHK2349162.1 hypothetical protein [Clostridium perfringens]EIA17025.1 hypothetical protein HA1_08507 [Clostridium perfringens F262]MDM0834523.1 hypothetical protein [Clostridium perfringens]MDU2433664.1 hypothetical protein [Clostridium perfringens]MDU2514955.1 hypothetical protein [Clostridium perfringens]
MEIRIIYNYVIQSCSKGYPVITEDIIKINNETTLEDIFKYSNQENADVSKYYKISGGYYFNRKILPYIKNKNNEVIWEPEYKNIKVLDFIFTHDIQDNTIYADTEITQAGGPELNDVSQLWNHCYPIIDQIVTVVCFYELSIKLSNFIKGLFKGKKIEQVPPNSFIEFILSKDKWNHYELAEYMEITPEESKNLLKGFGYKWDNSKKIYINRNNLKEILEKFSKISIYKNL